MARAEVPQSQAELNAHLQEQLGFLEASANAYDGGFEGEAKRLAVTIRVLLHHFKTSKALLEQLGLLDSTKFFDSALPNLPGNVSTYAGLVVTAHIKDGTKYLPMLDDHQMGPGEWVPFPSWWGCTVFVDDSKRCITRRDLVLSVADQDGGAHVDPGLNQAYADLSRFNSLGWVVKKGGVERPEDPPHLASVRQIAHEVLKSLRPGYTKHGPPIKALMYTAGVAVFDSPTGPQILPPFLTRPLVRPAATVPIAGRNDPCPCGSGKKFKKCHGGRGR